ncbi:MAG: PilC/PilY family type IV pilus protein, partial [Gallionellaceae bacterium]|nr:PilC/PilY family type IV pilus protein [Gallionellaceae bacterium]
IELMSSGTSATTSSTTLAADIATRITLGGYSATAAGSTVTITGLPVNASSLIVTQSGTMTLERAIRPAANATKLQNFANWYSYYRTRMLMMKTAAGRAFSSLNNSYRVGMMKISQTSPVVSMGVFEGTQRDTWYSSLYNMTTSGSTPLRRALSDAGRYYAGKLPVPDPVQYSCQQNFTILSTDGYWNTGDGYQIDGSTPVGNQDGTAPRPMYDGSQTGTTVTITYTRNNYSRISSGCTGGQRRLQTQPQNGSCSVAVAGIPTGAESCTPTSWSNSGAATFGSCSSSVTLPSPNPSNKVETSRVTTPGAYGGTSDNLADIAMYYYQTDLRTSTLGNCTGALGAGTNVCTNNVFRSGNDNNLQQHMTTFTLGLGASGWMGYSPSYLTDTSGDYVSVKLGSTASASVCTWQASGTVCNWPVPGMDGSSNGYIANIDDLWHAAVNGRGAYFSATNPSSLSAGLSNALAGINARKGSAAAAATSTLNPVAGNNFAYVASYTTVAWKGNLEARGINVDTGVVNENAAWCVENVIAGSCPAPGSIVADTSGATTAYHCVTPDSVTCPGGTLIGTECHVPVATACTGTMNSMVADTSDTRNIYTANSSGIALVAFDAAYAAANPASFNAGHISGLSQWTTLTTAQQINAVGTNLVNFLRGQYGYEDRTSNPVANRLYRAREAVLGDALESQPAFIGAPVFKYPYTGYSAYKTAQASRPGTVFMGANDGMMHAFAADTGVERWAYVPSMVIPNLWKLADKNYAASHINFVNGSPITSDIYCPGNCGGVTDVTYGDSASWRTILVAGLNGGGRGYYALDITIPNSPTLLWEFTPTTGSGKIKDDDVGYGFGQPIITRKSDGTWVVVVTSGYNNTSPGNGQGYLYVLDANTGGIISKIATGAGSTTTPSGLAKIAGWNNEPGGNLAGYIYGGDLLGNVWRFDINSTAAAFIGTGEVMRFATLFSDAAGTSPQPVTAAPVLGSIAGQRVVFIGTGKYLETSDLTTTQVQTQYAIEDNNASATLVNPRNTLVRQTLTNNPDGTATRLSSNNAVNFYTGRGWYVDFPDSGERVSIDSKLVQGTLLVATVIPSNTACAPGGYGWLNFLNYQTGGAVDISTSLASVKYDAPIVGVNVIYVQGQPKVGVVTSTNPTPELNSDVAFSASAAGFSGKRVIWRELIP